MKEFTLKEFDKAENTLGRYLKKAKNYLDDDDKINKLLIDAEKKFEALKDQKINIPLSDGVKAKLEGNLVYLGEALSYVPRFIALAYNFVKGDYRDVSIASVLAIVASIAYLVSPLDAIPDFIPGAGYIDDAAIVLLCVYLTKNELDKFDDWRQNNGK